MSAGRYNFTIERGATFSRAFTYTSPTNVPIDLSGAAIYMQIRDNYSSVTPAISLSLGSGITFTNPVLGQFTVLITASQTNGISFAQGVYDIEIVYATTTVERILEGRVKVKSQVTQ